jgi:hypothetical protein
MKRAEAVQRLRTMKMKLEVSLRNSITLGQPALEQKYREKVGALEYALGAIARLEGLEK